MLQTIRDRAQGVFAWLVIGVIILSFGLWGVNSYLKDSDSGIHAAIVNGQEVSVYEYQIAFNNEQARIRQMLGASFKPEMFEEQLKKSALDRVIDNTMLTQRASESGMRVSDSQLGQMIHGIDAFQEAGVFSKKMYEQQLKTSGEPVSAFENRVRKALLADQLIQGIGSTGIATQKDVERIYKLREQEREVAYLKLPLEGFLKGVTVSDADVQAFYSKNQERYQTPEMVDLEYVEVSAADLAPGVQVSDSDIATYYDEQKSRFQGDEQRRARHILVEFGADEAKAKLAAQDLIDRIKKGESFEELAKKNSKDPGSAAQGGDLGFFGRGVMDKPFEEAAFALGKGEMTPAPVKSKFGFHVIRVDEVKSGKAKPLDEVKGSLVTELKRQKAEKMFAEKADVLSTTAFESPRSLDGAAGKLGLQKKTTGFFPRSGGPGITANAKVQKAAFSTDVLKDGVNSELIDLGDNHSVVVRLKEHKPAQIRPLEEVRAQITTDLRDQSARKEAEVKGKQLLEKLKGGADSVALGKEFGATVTPRASVKRNDGKLSPEIGKAAFAVARPSEGKPTVGSLALPNGDYVVYAVYAVKDGDPAALKPEEKVNIAKGLSSSVGMDEFALMLKSIKEKAKIQRFPNNLR